MLTEVRAEFQRSSASLEESLVWLHAAIDIHDVYAVRICH